jgi:hypothetical protein
VGKNKKSMKKYLFGIKSSITRLPDKKRYLELITALLSVPVLATAILLNFNNLKPKETPTPTPPVQERIVVISPSDKTDASKTQTEKEDCIQDIAPLEIASPSENETISDNPVIIDINYTQGKYCASVWSYRINDGRWSDYDDKSIALYNLPKGTVRFDLRVKSIVTGQQKNYSRTFTYAGSATDTQPTASSSASL